MNKFFCTVDDGSDEGRWHNISNARDAAGIHAQAMHDESAGESGDAQVIRVRDEAGVETVFDITMDWSPSFYAKERATKEPA